MVFGCFTSRCLTTVRLETNRVLAEAQALDHQEGYQEVAPFNTEPYAHHWFEKRLETAAATNSR
jgi:hypothetical protein